MPLFKKLNEQIQKVEFKEKVRVSLTESEKKLLEKEIIFGTVLEDLEADLIEQQYQELKGE